MPEKFEPDALGAIEKAPAEYRTLETEELQNDFVIEEVAETYKTIFGSQDIWGEGYKCSQCGKTFPLEGGQPKECVQCKSQEVKEFYPLQDLKERIKSEMEEKPDIKPVMSVMEKSGKIKGFLWGAAGPREKIIDRLTNKYSGQEKEGLSSALLQRLNNIGVNEDAWILAGDELGILKQDREGAVPVMMLAKLWLEHGLKNNAKTAVFWTSKRSPIYAICVAGGFVPVHDTSDGMTYMVHPDSTELVNAMRGGEQSFLEFMSKEK